MLWLCTMNASCSSKNNTQCLQEMQKWRRTLSFVDSSIMLHFLCKTQISQLPLTHQAKWWKSAVKPLSQLLMKLKAIYCWENCSPQRFINFTRLLFVRTPMCKNCIVSQPSIFQLLFSLNWSQWSFYSSQIAQAHVNLLSFLTNSETETTQHCHRHHCSPFLLNFPTECSFLMEMSFTLVCCPLLRLPK